MRVICIKDFSELVQVRKENNIFGVFRVEDCMPVKGNPYTVIDSREFSGSVYYNLEEMSFPETGKKRWFLSENFAIESPDLEEQIQEALAAPSPEKLVTV